ncbi:hypothetical protein FOA52_004603 [Chlamydomonas sp. UWO 241]|nr:hypothetical protein FOA52_004603 [Chlamydomonas sp. UWO 241]
MQHRGTNTLMMHTRTHGAAMHQAACRVPRPRQPPCRCTTGAAPPQLDLGVSRAGAAAVLPSGARRARPTLTDPTPAGPLPPLQDCRHFVNLTNGIEALPVLQELGLQSSFCRLQSTACEQGHLEALLLGLDANMLMALAQGHCCLMWDLGSRNKEVGVPRAMWYGLEFVRYVLYRKWLKRRPRVHLRGRVVAQEFDARMDGMRDSTLRQISYYAKWLRTDELRLYGVYRATENELVPGFYDGVLDAHNAPGARVPDASAGAVGGGGDASMAAGVRDEGIEASEALLASHGYRVHYRGLSPSEWEAFQVPRQVEKRERAAARAVVAVTALL